MKKHTHVRIAIVTAAAAALASLSCAKEGVVAAEPREVKKADPAAISTPFVQAGTELTLVMRDAIGTQMSIEGTPFTATVERDVLASDGTVIVPAGSTVNGKVARVDSGITPVLALDFRSIGTRWGNADISAKLKGAERVSFAGRDETYDPYDATHYDAYFYPPGAVSYPAGVMPPGHPLGYYDYYDENTREIRLPAGARVRVELTRPIIPPR